MNIVILRMCRLNDLCKSCKPQGIPTCELLQDAAKKIKGLNVWVKNHLDEVSSLQEKVYFVSEENAGLKAENERLKTALLWGCGSGPFNPLDPSTLPKAEVKK